MYIRTYVRPHHVLTYVWWIDILHLRTYDNKFMDISWLVAMNNGWKCYGKFSIWNFYFTYQHLRIIYKISTKKLVVICRSLVNKQWHTSRVSFRGREHSPLLGFGLSPLRNFDMKVNQFKCFEIYLIVALCIINVNKRLKYCMYVYTF